MNIHKLAFDGDLEGMCKLIAEAPDRINETLELTFKGKAHRITPIFLAAIQGNQEMMNLLLANHALTELTDETDHLVDWVDHGPPESNHAIVSLLKRDKNFKSFDLTKETYKLNNIQIKLLLSSNQYLLKNPKTSERDYYVLLGARGSMPSIEKLLEANPTKEIVDSVLLGAISSSRIEVLELLHKKKFPFAERISTGNSENEYPAVIAVTNGLVDVLEFLEKAGVKLLEPLDTGLTLAYLAAAHDGVDALKFLKMKGANLSESISRGPNLGLTLAYGAAVEGKVAALRYLNEVGVKLNEPLKSGPAAGATPICSAATAGRKESVEFLYHMGVSITEVYKEGPYKGTSLMDTAVEMGRVEIVEFLHDSGVSITESAHGPKDPRVPVAIAAIQGHVNVLEYLGRYLDLSEPVKNIFNGQSLTLASIAAGNNQVECLKFFKKLGINLLSSKNDDLSPLCQAAVHGKVGVLEYFKSEGLYKIVLPRGVFISEKNQAVETYNRVKLASHEEIAEILYQKIDNDPEWFSIYKQQFLEHMKEIPVSVWIKKGNWEKLLAMSKLYEAQGGKDRHWIEEVVVEMINSDPNFDVHLATPYLKHSSIEDFKDAVRPGKPLLELLKWVSTETHVLNRSKMNSFERWGSVITKQSSTDDEFWILALENFQEIHKQLSSQPAKNKRQPKIELTMSFWAEFNKHIKDATTTSDQLNQKVQTKVAEWESNEPQYLKEIEDVLNQFLTSLQLESSDQALGAISEDIEKNFHLRKSNAVKNMLQRSSQLTTTSKEELQKHLRSLCSEALQSTSGALLSQLDAQLAKLEKQMDDGVLNVKRELQRQLTSLSEELQKTISSLQTIRDFQLEQKAAKEEELVLDLSDVEQFTKLLKEKAQTIWQTRQAAIQNTTTREELLQIRAHYSAALVEAKKEVIEAVYPSAPAEINARTQRVMTHLEQKNEMLVKENHDLKKRIEQLEKTPTERPKSPEKIAPIVEKTLKPKLLIS